jgi:DNA-directed RNA polymerase subunit beta'
VLEYFISTHGARKGLADTALKTADSGYMTRKLVDVAQDVIVTEEDCGTVNGITVRRSTRATRRSSSSQPHLRPHQLRAGQGSGHRRDHRRRRRAHPRQARKLQDDRRRAAQDPLGAHLRKPRGCCAKCYGLNLATGRTVKIGEAVGIIAAQSIGEPGTQLTMRTFHVGGVATATFKQPIIKAKNKGIAALQRPPRRRQSEEGTWSRSTRTALLGPRQGGQELESLQLVIGSNIARRRRHIKKGDQIVTWDPYNVPIITEKAGKSSSAT